MAGGAGPIPTGTEIVAAMVAKANGKAVEGELNEKIKKVEGVKRTVEFAGYQYTIDKKGTTITLLGFDEHEDPEKTTQTELASRMHNTALRRIFNSEDDRSFRLEDQEIEERNEEIMGERRAGRDRSSAPPSRESRESSTTPPPRDRGRTKSGPFRRKRAGPAPERDRFPSEDA